MQSKYSYGGAVKMPRPTKIKLPISVIDVEYVDDLTSADDDKLNGACSLSREHILMEKSIGKNFMKHVLLHELFHMMTSNCQIELNETEVDVISLQLQYLIENNHGLIKWIQEK